MSLFTILQFHEIFFVVVELNSSSSSTSLDICVKFLLNMACKENGGAVMRKAASPGKLRLIPWTYCLSTSWSLDQEMSRLRPRPAMLIYLAKSSSSLPSSMILQLWRIHPEIEISTECTSSPKYSSLICTSDSACGEPHKHKHKVPLLAGGKRSQGPQRHVDPNTILTILWPKCSK